jgi:hypothetical protein
MATNYNVWCNPSSLETTTKPFTLQTFLEYQARGCQRITGQVYFLCLSLQPELTIIQCQNLSLYQIPIIHKLPTNPDLTPDRIRNTTATMKVLMWASYICYCLTFDSVWIIGLATTWGSLQQQLLTNMRSTTSTLSLHLRSFCNWSTYFPTLIYVVRSFLPTSARGTALPLYWSEMRKNLQKTNN